ncbi:hypothetical protein [Nocardia sp. NPDC059239]|uniref:hypothetical protein n=1 Tax=Nocardia sp. NPDC059239 TaxID=3346785 RepID=UPI0036BE1789
MPARSQRGELVGQPRAGPVQADCGQHCPLKLPALRDRVRETAAEHCITASMLIRQYIEMGLAAEQPERTL